MKNIYTAPHLSRSHHSVSLTEQERLIEQLNQRDDSEAERIKRYLSLPDLTREEGSPVKSITDRVVNLATLKSFDVIETPEFISSELVFDLFNFPLDHPARSRSDTYYVDEKYILRPHTSLMWKYYLEIADVKNQLEKHGSAGVLSYGTVYRRDEIDWQHSNVLHQIDGLFICKKEIKDIKQQDLESILWEVARVLFGKDIVGRFNIEHYPYTNPSLEMEIEWDDKWVEILGAGIVHPDVIKNLGLDPNVYGGWAFGFGADRLAMIKMGIPDIRLLRSTDSRVVKQLKDVDNTYKPVSKYPPVLRDLSLIVPNKTFNLNVYYEMIRDVVGEDMIEEAKLIDKYEDADKFGKDRISYTFRIQYRHLDRTLTNEEVNELHNKLEDITQSKLGAEVR